MPMQAIDNYSDFVEMRNTGVMVVLAERREDSTFAALSCATKLLTSRPHHVHRRARSQAVTAMAGAEGHTQRNTDQSTRMKTIIKH